MLTLSKNLYQQFLSDIREKRPLIHCLTNEVVQEITANVLLSAHMSPAMCVAYEEVESFAKIASAVYINIGTPYHERLKSMHLAVHTANTHNIVWALDPVAAGVMPWRDSVIRDFLELKPTLVRGNASEILALAGLGQGGHGVDSTDSSKDAVQAAQSLASRYDCLVAVTGESDFATDGTNTYEIKGGHELATFVVGTGCSLSALCAGFCAIASPENRLAAVAGALTLAKQAQEQAFTRAKAPGSFHCAYLDELYSILKNEATHG